MKRRLTKLVVFLLLGVIVNVAVAWGCANWVDFDRRMARRQGGYDHFAGWGLPPDDVDAGRFGSYTVSRYQRFGSQRVSVHRSWAYSGAPGKTTIGFNEIIPQWARGFLLIPKLNAGESSGLFNETLTHTAIVDGRGWPLLSLWGGMKLPNPGLTIVGSDGKPFPLTHRRYCIIVMKPASSQGAFTDLRWLPLLPIWPGFAINTIFYAALLWLLTLGPFTARRLIRRKRGLCIKCGYDLRGDFSSGCPECGWRRAEKDAEQPA